MFQHEQTFGRGDTTAQVSVVMGSRSDWEPCMMHACRTLDELHIPFETGVVSAHRTPQRMFSFAQRVAQRGIQVVIAGAGGAAHLPGMISSETHIPVLGVPVKSSALSGLDSLLSIVQMPGGVPTPTLSIGKSGAINAALSAARIIGLGDVNTSMYLQQFIDRQRESVPVTPYDEG